MIIYSLVLVVLTIIFITTFHYKKDEYIHISKKDHPLSFLYGTAFFIQDFTKKLLNKNGNFTERERRVSSKLSRVYPEINPIILVKLHKAKIYTLSLAIIYFVAIIGIIISLSNTTPVSSITSLDRPTNGDELSSYELNVEINGETTDIVLEIESKSYTLEEVLSYFDSNINDIEATLLGDNSSLYEVNSDLCFKSDINDIKIKWQVDNYNYIDTNGKIIMENIPKEGTAVSVYANLTYGGHSATLTFPIFIIKENYTPSLKDEIMSEIDRLNDPHNNIITLPDSINGAKVTFTSQTDTDSSSYFF